MPHNSKSDLLVPGHTRLHRGTPFSDLVVELLVTDNTKNVKWSKMNFTTNEVEILLQEVWINK